MRRRGLKKYETCLPLTVISYLIFPLSTLEHVQSFSTTNRYGTLHRYDTRDLLEFGASYSQFDLKLGARSFFHEEDSTDINNNEDEQYIDEDVHDYALGKFQDDTSTNKANDSALENKLSANAQMQSQLQQQQKQIEMLMEMVKSQQSQSQIQPERPQSKSQQITQALNEKLRKESSLDEMIPEPLPNMFNDEGEEELLDTSTFTNELPLSGNIQESNSLYNTQSNMMPVVPLKAMLFIDGTWLYYSLYRREEKFDPIVKKYGKGWQYRYKIDWNELPRIVCQQIVGQQTTLGWSYSGAKINEEVQRPVEVVRASVFTSYKKTTDPRSLRVKLYEEMSAANFDIHMLESTSNGPEKCVDISLAVEMLHYATVPNAYDVAILLSGDKDFIPAMVRTRQKGRKVGVVSMRTGCNRALYESPHIKDFDVVWLDDFLDRLLVPLPAEQVGKKVQSVVDRGLLSVFTITKVIYDFISQSPFDKVSSRDVGRYLKNIEVPGGTSILDDVKVGQGGLRRFLQDRVPMVFDVNDPPQYLLKDPNDKSYWISKKADGGKFLLEEAKRTKFSEEETEFLKSYQADVVEKGDVGEDVYYYTIDAMESSPPRNLDAVESFVLPSLAIERSQSEAIDYSSYKVAELKEVCRSLGLPVTGRKNELIERIRDNGREKNPSDQKISQSTTNSKLEKYLVDLVKYYIVESRGYASSRDLGRFLATNKGSTGSSTSALSELKENFGGVAAFLNQRNDIFTTVREASDGDPMNYSFGIKLKNQVEVGLPTTTNASSLDRGNNMELIDKHVEALIKEYLTASGGEASSRNIGRYLAANSALDIFHDDENSTKNGRKKRNTALKQLKEYYGSLASYLNQKKDLFLKVSSGFRNGRGELDPPSEHSFGVRLKK